MLVALILVVAMIVPLAVPAYACPDQKPFHYAIGLGTLRWDLSTIGWGDSYVLTNFWFYVKEPGTSGEW